MQRVGNLLLTLIVVAIAVFLIWSISKVGSKKPISPSYKELEHHIDSLNNELKSIKLERDSLYNVVDSSIVKIDTINHWYEKEFINITNQSIASDCVFFTKYLSEVNK